MPLGDNVGSSVVTSGQDVDGGEALDWGDGDMEVSVISAQPCCEPKTALKNNLH